MIFSFVLKFSLFHSAPPIWLSCVLHGDCMQRYRVTPKNPHPCFSAPKITNFFSEMTMLRKRQNGFKRGLGIFRYFWPFIRFFWCLFYSFRKCFELFFRLLNLGFSFRELVNLLELFGTFWELIITSLYFVNGFWTIFWPFGLVLDRYILLIDEIALVAWIYLLLIVFDHMLSMHPKSNQSLALSCQQFSLIYKSEYGIADFTKISAKCNIFMLIYYQ